MPKILNLEYYDKRKNVTYSGKMEIKNLSAKSADLYFYGDIVSSTWSAWEAEDKCPQDVADFLNQLSGTESINIYINSGGGDSFAGLAIYNMLKRNSAYKTVHVDGLAASAASVIALAGNKIVIPTSAQFMIHNPWTIAMGDANDFRKLADTLDKIGESYVNVYLENAKEGVTAEKIKEMMDVTTWMTGSDAAKHFNVEVVDMQVAAYASSQYFNNYSNLPDGLKQVTGENPEYVKKSDVEAMIQAAISDLQQNPGQTPPQSSGDNDKSKIELAKARLKLACEM